MKNPTRLLSAPLLPGGILLGGILLGCLSDYQDQYKLRPDGAYKPLNRETTLKDCTDRSDNNLNGLVDCDDPGCGIYGICHDTSGADAENTLPLCKDGVDNDADALVDCKDPDCMDLYVCSLPAQDTVFIVDYKTTGRLSPAIRGRQPPYNLAWYFNGGDVAGGDALGLRGTVPGRSEETAECGVEPVCRKITFTETWGIAFTLFFDEAGAQDTVDLSSWMGTSLKLSIRSRVPNLRIKLEAKHLADAVEIPLADIGFDPSKAGWQDLAVPFVKWTTSYKLSTNRLPFSIWKPGGPGGDVYLENIRLE